MRPSGSPEALEQRRLRALALLKGGLMPVEVAQQLGVDRRSVRRWKSAARRKGEAALAAKPAPGRPAKLDAAGRRRLERWLLKGAQAAGYESDLWTCPRVRELIQRQLHVEYHVGHVPRLLRAMGWTPQKPARRAIERDEAGIANWIKTDWARVKKTPNA
jgi:transposase